MRSRFLTLVTAPMVAATSCSTRHFECIIHPLRPQDARLGIEYAAAAQRFSDPAGVLAVRPDTALPAASIVKLLIAIALIDVTNGNINLAAGRGNANVPIPPIDTLLRRMIQHSDNDAANALINFLTIPVINGVAVTRLHGPFITSRARIEPRTFTTARECITMLKHILVQRQAQSTEVARSYGLLLDAMTAQDDRRFFPAAAPGGTVIANKTGEIHGELNDVAIVEPYGKNPLLLSLLAHGNFDEIYGQRHFYYDAVTEVSALARCLYDKAVEA